MIINIPFNKPYLTGQEIEYIKNAHQRGQLAGDGVYTKLCNAWLKNNTHSNESLLTHSCTAALEMAALLIDVNPGDEIIMPSYTFVSTANAFVLRGGVPVFVDIRPDTLNIDEQLIEAAITKKTKAIVVVHYAGVACEMDRILEIANQYQLFLIEDAAQGIMSSYKGRALGSIGNLGCLSFHETKNIISGEGGALLMNDPTFIERAEIILEKGTNRKRFFRGQVDKYTWTDVGSSYLPGELIAAFLYAQMEKASEITDKRKEIWSNYHESFKELEDQHIVRRPVVPKDCVHNGHIYYLLLESIDKRDYFINELAKEGIASVFHYVPLHSSTFGKKYMRKNRMDTTTLVSSTLVRLPLWIGLEAYQDEVIERAVKILKIIN
jgi:dTDP-4-amino-4,6-dideoxygalactose transaminase